MPSRPKSRTLDSDLGPPVVLLRRLAARRLDYTGHLGLVDRSLLQTRHRIDKSIYLLLDRRELAAHAEASLIGCLRDEEGIRKVLPPTVERRCRHPNQQCLKSRDSIAACNVSPGCRDCAEAAVLVDPSHAVPRESVPTSRYIVPKVCPHPRSKRPLTRLPDVYHVPVLKQDVNAALFPNVCRCAVGKDSIKPSTEPWTAPTPNNRVGVPPLAISGDYHASTV